jgi:hypothetical protein
MKGEPCRFRKKIRLLLMVLTRLMSRSKWWLGEESIRWELEVYTVICKIENDGSLGMEAQSV